MSSIMRWRGGQTGLSGIAKPPVSRGVEPILRQARALALSFSSRCLQALTARPYHASGWVSWRNPTVASSNASGALAPARLWRLYPGVLPPSERQESPTPPAADHWLKETGSHPDVCVRASQGRRKRAVAVEVQVYCAKQRRMVNDAAECPRSSAQRE
jgi:hypothetical protein